VFLTDASDMGVRKVRVRAHQIVVELNPLHPALLSYGSLNPRYITR
jgi:hypothetical protein